MRNESTKSGNANLRTNINYADLTAEDVGTEFEVVEDMVSRIKDTLLIIKNSFEASFIPVIPDIEISKNYSAQASQLVSVLWLLLDHINFTLDYLQMNIDSAYKEAKKEKIAAEKP